MLEHSMNFIKSRIFVNSTYNTLKNISEYFGCLEWLNTPLIHRKVFRSKWIVKVIFDVLSWEFVFILVVEEN